MRMGLVLGLVLMLGCTAAPTAVLSAHNTEGKAIAVSLDTFQKVVNAYDADLRTAYMKHLDESYDSMIAAAGKDGNVPLAKFTELTTQYREQREKILTDLDALKVKVLSAQNNFDIALKIHEAIAEYLNRKTITADDVRMLMDQVSVLATQIQQPAGK